MNKLDSVALYTVTTITRLTEVHIAVVECLSCGISLTTTRDERRTSECGLMI